MKKLSALLLVLALAASLSLTAFAAEEKADAAGATADEAPAADAAVPPSATRVWGKVSPWDGEGILLKNDDKDDPFNEVVVHLGDAPLMDAATGLPLDPGAIKEGDTLYVWVGPAAAMSLPPQVYAIAAVGNVPADAAAPEYVQISGQAQVKDGNTVLPLAGGKTLTVTKDTVLTPWLTKQMVRVEDLLPGAELFAVTDDKGVAQKIILFPYAYQSFMTVASGLPHGDVLACINGFFEEGDTMPRFACRKTEEGLILAPVRAIAEAAGYDVRWDKTLGAVVSLNGETVLSVRPDASTIQTPGGDADISVPCVLDKGVTYLPLADLAMWLNIYHYYC